MSFDAIRRGGTVGLPVPRSAVFCLRFGEIVVFGCRLFSAFRVSLASGQLCHGSLGQHEERHNHQTQNSGHGHDVGLHVSAGHQGVQDVARRIAERHAAEHEGHPEPEDVQGVLVAAP